MINYGSIATKNGNFAADNQLGETEKQSDQIQADHAEIGQANANIEEGDGGNDAGKISTEIGSTSLHTV